MRFWAPRGRDIMNIARSKAVAMNHAELDPLHLLWAFLREAALAGQPQGGAGTDPILALQRTERELEALPRANRTLFPSPNSRLRELILKAADVATVTDDCNEAGLIGPHELILALVADRGPAGDMLQGFHFKAVQMAG